MERNRSKRRKENNKHSTRASKNNTLDLSNTRVPRYSSKYAISINSLNPCNRLQIKENQGTERLRDFPKVTQLVNNANWI